MFNVTERSFEDSISRFESSKQSDRRAQASYERFTEEVDDGKPTPYLDLFSTSAEFYKKAPSHRRTCASLSCINSAPFFAYNKHDRTYAVTQGCCNSWTCPRCGQLRAKQEYGRIIEGVRTLAKSRDEKDLLSPIYFITITCRGRDISVKDAEDNYLKWSHRALDSWRAQAKRSNQQWCYVAVTERQKRGHPHSHILTNWIPPKQYDGFKEDWKIDAQGVKRMEKISCLRSTFIERSIRVAGLGSQYDLSVARTVEGTARYVAKYLFKDDIFATIWPAGWKRVRYSNNFPKLPKHATDAFILLSNDDWKKLAKLAVFVDPKDSNSREECEWKLRGSDVVLLAKTNLS